MGNQQAAVQRERNKSGSQDLIPGSPIRGESSLLRSLENVQNRQHNFFLLICDLAEKRNSRQEILF